MRALVTVGAIVMVGALMGGVGFTLGQSRSTGVVETPEPASPWQQVLDAALLSAETGTLRAQALEVLNTADSDHALAESLAALGWVGTEEDLPLLESFARSGDPDLSRPAIEALGRLRTPGAVDVLLDLVERREVDRDQVLHALGLSGHPLAFERLVRELNGNEHKSAAAWGLAAFGTPEAIEALSAEMKRSHLWRVAEVARALGALSSTSAEAHASLQAVLMGPSGPRRTAVLLALAEARDPLVFETLMFDLRQGTARRSAEAAYALGHLGDPRAVAPLALAARNGHSDLRYAAVNSLGEINLAEADRALLELVDTAPAPIAARAVYALPRPKDPDTLQRLLEARAHRPTEVRETIDARLFEGDWSPQPPEEVLDLAREAITRNAFSGWGAGPVSLLLEYGVPEDLARLETLLDEGPLNSRMSACWTLEGQGSPLAKRLLLKLADDPDGNVRQAALSALLNQGMDDEVEQRAIAALEADGSNYGSTEHLLVQLGTPRAMRALFERIEAGTSMESSNAVSAIASSGSSEHVQRLLQLAENTDDPSLEAHILNSVVYSETVDLQTVADRALAHDNPELRYTAIHALTRMGTADARSRLLGLVQDERPETRQAALSAVAQLGGEEAEQALVAALDDPDVAWAAVSGLQQLGTPGARDALVAAARGEGSAEVRASVLHQVASMSDVDRIGILSAAASDDNLSVRQSAVSALESMGTTSAAEQLADLLDANGLDEEDRQMAASALKRMGGPVAERHADTIEALAPSLDTGIADIDY